MIPAFARLVLAAVILAAPGSADGQTVIESTFTATGGEWRNPNNWSPAQVPDNSAATSFNVTIGSYVRVFESHTVSNLRLAPPYGELEVNGGTLTVLETLTDNDVFDLRETDGRLSVRAEAGVNSALAVRTFSNFSNGTLTGILAIGAANSPNTSATFRFDGADVRRVSNGRLSLIGEAARLVDEAGQDALRNLEQIDAGASFGIAYRNFTTPGDFNNNGTLSVFQGTFNVAGSLSSFDAETRTLKSGVYNVSGRAGAPGRLRFAGADIVNNAASIVLDEEAAIVDEHGNNALRNFRHNMAGAEFETTEDFYTTGSFTNHGTIGLRAGGLVVNGSLTNFDPGTRTLTGGRYYLRSRGLTFNNADVVRNAAFLYLSGAETGIIDQFGNDGLRNFAFNDAGGSLTISPGKEFTVPGDFTNAGTLWLQRFVRTTNPYDEFKGHFAAPDGNYTQTGGRTVNDGVLSAKTISIEAGTLTGLDGEFEGDVSIGAATYAPRGVTLTDRLILGKNSRSRFLLGDPEQRGDNDKTLTGQATFDGTLEIELAPGFVPDPRTDFFLISAGSGVIGRFANAPDGARLTTADGAGSFLVTYGSTFVSLSAFQPNPAPMRLLNIATRAEVRRGENALIGGFIVTGNEPKKIMLRGIGPSLLDAGVAGVLGDPIIELHDSAGAILRSNDDWPDSEQADEIRGAGLRTPYYPESVIIATLSPGAYTVVLRGARDSTGVGLVEVYDLTRFAASRLANISTRAFVDRGEKVLIGGFIAGGDQTPTSEVVIRALGPDLARSGVADALQDPTLEVRDRDGELIVANDDHADSPRKDEIAAAGLAPNDRREAAVRLTAAPGNHTVLVRGKDDTTGVALVEVYDVGR